MATPYHFIGVVSIVVMVNFIDRRTGESA